VPQPRNPGRTTVTRSNGSTEGAPEAQVTLEQAAQIRAGMAAKEQAPSSRVASVFQNWREIADVLGDPYERERIPVSKLKQMRRDPMLGFGLSFIKTPHVRAKWYINARSNSGPNLQIANHLDYDLRRIYASLVLQLLNSIDFGFQAIAKRFEFRIPAGTYIETNPDTGEQEERPLWSEGGIEPIAWKTFQPLRPEGVEPIWSTAGEFDGIEYAPTGANTGQAQSGSGGSGASQTRGGAGGTNKEETFKIDLAHSLWMTNEKDANFGSIFGYPRLGYAYSYWWSYWFRWAIADRAFERKADPSVLVYHPEGDFVNEDTGETMSYSEYALLMGERMRSGGVIALPSEVYEDNNGRGTMRQWEIDFTKDSVNFEPFDDSFEYLDVQKLRALFIPEQAFLEGKGGTSSRNVADTMGSAFTESQDLLSKQIVDHINRFVIPQWIAANYPEFLEDGGIAELVVQGFADDDRDFALQLIQLLGQQENGQRELMKYVDIKRMLEERGTPITTFAEQQRREAEAIAAQQALAGPQAPGGIGGAPPAPGTAVAPTTTGFSYVATQPHLTVSLADTGTDFITNLPGTVHYADNAVKGFARILWNLFRDLYRDEYETAAAALDATVALSDDDLALANEERVKKLLERWRGSSKWDATYLRSQDVMKSIMKRAARVELSRLRKAGRVTDDEVAGWITNHLAEMLAKAAETTRNEVEGFVERQFDEGVTDPAEIATALRQHFGEFPQWKADRLVRTEVRDLYNQGTLLAASASGVERVMALDNQGPVPYGGDDACAARHGQIYAIPDAMRERDHPNGTLAWRMVPDDLSITFADDLDGADFDEDALVLTLSDKLDEEARERITAEAVEYLTT
jgi:hypothetical protein